MINLRVVNSSANFAMPMDVPLLETESSNSVKYTTNV